MMLADPALRYPIYIDPQWSSDYNSNRTVVDSGYPNNEYWDWAGRGNATDQRVGKCPRDTSACDSSDVTRIFFIVPTSAYLGSDKQILQANFNVTLKAVENPTNAYGTQLWRTGGVDGGTNWGNQPGERAGPAAPTSAPRTRRVPRAAGRSSGTSPWTPRRRSARRTPTAGPRRRSA
ncbi:hypothetical protein ACFQ1L_16705 [Phytohabitans flavus]